MKAQRTGKSMAEWKPSASEEHEVIKTIWNGCFAARDSKGESTGRVNVDATQSNF